MSTCAESLYEWIRVASEARERMDLPPGAIENAVSVLQKAFGDEYLQTLLPSEGEPRRRIITAREDEPLGYWLSGPGIDSSVIQVLETAAVIESFLTDPCLPKKIERMKTHSFWPFFHELAMASRVKRSLDSSGRIALSAEEDKNNGDFIVEIDGGCILCECARLTYTPHAQEGERVTQDIFDYIGDKVRSLERRRCVKIRVNSELLHSHFNVVIALLKRTLEKYERTGETAMASSQQGVEVSVEPLNERTESIPSTFVESKAVEVVGTDWTNGVSIGYAGVGDSAEVSRMFRAGTSYGFREHTRVLIHYTLPSDLGDPYARLSAKIKRKVSQTKISTADKTAKFLWIDSPYDLRSFDHDALQKDAVEAMRSSRHTLGVMITYRDGNPHFRHNCSLFGIFNRNGIPDFPKFIASLDVLRQNEISIDPITGWKYHRTWEEAAARSERETAELERLRRPNIVPALR